MRKIIITLMLIVIILTACTSNQAKDPPSPKDKDTDITKISTKEETKQDVSNHAKDILKQYDNITSIVAVNTKKKLVIGIRVHHGSRFQLKSLQKKWEKRVKKEFPKMDIKLTTDQKIFWELTDLETKLKETSMSKKYLQTKLKKIIKLMNEKA